MRPTTPRGFRDVLPRGGRGARASIGARAVRALFASWGYRPVETPGRRAALARWRPEPSPPLEGTRADRRGHRRLAAGAAARDDRTDRARSPATRLSDAGGPVRLSYARRRLPGAGVAARPAAAVRRRRASSSSAPSGPPPTPRSSRVLVGGARRGGASGASRSASAPSRSCAHCSRRRGPRAGADAVMAAAHRRDLWARPARRGGLGTWRDRACEAHAALREVVRLRGGREAVDAARGLDGTAGFAEALDELEATLELARRRGRGRHGQRRLRAHARLRLLHAASSSRRTRPASASRSAAADATTASSRRSGPRAARRGSPSGSSGSTSPSPTRVGCRRSRRSTRSSAARRRGLLRGGARAARARAGAWRCRPGRPARDCPRRPLAAEAVGAVWADGRVARASGTGRRARPRATTRPSCPPRPASGGASDDRRGRRQGRRPAPDGRSQGIALRGLARACCEGAGVDVSPLRDPGRQLMVVRAGASRSSSRGPPTSPRTSRTAPRTWPSPARTRSWKPGSTSSSSSTWASGAAASSWRSPRTPSGPPRRPTGTSASCASRRKYPNVTERHFAERGVQVEVVKLHGNIELAPLIGLADRIVDITATGRTLAENHLRIVEDVLDSTARFVANPVSAALFDDRITDLAERLAESAAAPGGVNRMPFLQRIDVSADEPRRSRPGAAAGWTPRSSTPRSASSTRSASRGDEALRRVHRALRPRRAHRRRPARDARASSRRPSPRCPSSSSRRSRSAAIAIEDFHRRQVQQSWFTTVEGGIFLGQKVTPIERVGIYVPGGRASYPSTVLMNAIPAIVAGVDEIAMVVPARGRTAPSARTCSPPPPRSGVTEVYRCGGAQAIAALAYGTATIPRVDKICGPGNAYVTAAKKLVTGDVGIDMLAGPSEVLVLADDTAEPEFVAIDLMAQAEHDPRAAVYLVTTEPELVDEVEDALAVLLAESPRAELIDRVAARQRPRVRVRGRGHRARRRQRDRARAPRGHDGRRRSSCSARSATRARSSSGPWTPESVGDYVAGPNHTLPTGGTARFSSPLSVEDFVKKSSVISYSAEALEADGATDPDHRRGRGPGRARPRRVAAPGAHRGDGGGGGARGRGGRGARARGERRRRRPGRDRGGRVDGPRPRPRDPNSRASSRTTRARSSAPSSSRATRTRATCRPRSCASSGAAVAEFDFNRYPGPDGATACASSSPRPTAWSRATCSSATAATSSSSTCSWRGAVPGAACSTCRRPSPCTRSTRRSPARAVHAVPRLPDFPIDEDAFLTRVASRVGRRHRRQQPEQPHGHASRRRRCSSTRSRPPTRVVLVDEAYFEFSRTTMRPHLDRHRTW